MGSRPWRYAVTASRFRGHHDVDGWPVGESPDLVGLFLVLDVTWASMKSWRLFWRTSQLPRQRVDSSHVEFIWRMISLDSGIACA